MNNYAISNFCIHNSAPIMKLKRDYWDCVAYMREKWKKYLPIKTCVVSLRKNKPEMLIAKVLLTVDISYKRRKRGQIKRLSTDCLYKLTRKYQ